MSKFKDSITELFARAKEHGITLKSLAEASERDISTFTRWKWWADGKEGGQPPNMAVFEGVETALDGLIAEKGHIPASVTEMASEP